jgi:hypothetical protein
MAMKRILVLADDPRDGEDVAQDLFRAGYLAPSVDYRDLPHLILCKPDLVVVCFSFSLERSQDLAHASAGMKGVPILVVSALRLSQLEAPLRILPIVSGVLFKPYSNENLSNAVREATSGPAILMNPVPLQG